MNVPANLKYSSDHEWCRIEGDTAVIGITDFAQSQLGDIVFVDVPTVGETLAAGEVFGSIEAVKTVTTRSFRWAARSWNSTRLWTPIPPSSTATPTAKAGS